jgi:glycosyltransferase involved in cell wall biosynthesis
MKILLASTIKRNVTKDTTYSRSKVVYQIASELVKRGHDVSLLGTGDSFIEGVKIIPVIDKGFVDKQREEGYENPFYVEAGYLVKFVKKLEEIGEEFDVIHNHSYPEFLNLFATDTIKTPIVVTIHMSLTPGLMSVYDDVLSLFPKSHLVAISNSQKQHFKKATIEAVVYNGVDTNSFPFADKKDDYLLWLGRLGQAKNPDGSFVDAKGVSWAIKTAIKTGKKLILSGGVEDKEFFEKEVKPYLNDKIQWAGKVGKDQPLTTDELVHYYGRAKAFLMTPNWDEAFGLVIVEAMSCGTPVIAFNKGSIPEIVKDSKTGYLSSYEDGVDGLAGNVEKLFKLSDQEYQAMSTNARKRVEENFTIEKMVDGYEKVYKDVIGSSR